MAIAEKEGEEGEGEQLSPEEHWELMRCIEEALAQEVGTWRVRMCVCMHTPNRVNHPEYNDLTHQTKTRDAQVSLAEEWAAGEYSQLEHAEVEGSVAQLYDYEELPAGGCVCLNV